MAVNLQRGYNGTREIMNDVLFPYSYKQVKEANKAMKQVFGNRLSQMRATGPCEYTYDILCFDEEDQSWELDSFSWDFFYRSFAS